MVYREVLGSIRDTVSCSARELSSSELSFVGAPYGNFPFVDFPLHSPRYTVWREITSSLYPACMHDIIPAKTAFLYLGRA